MKDRSLDFSFSGIKTAVRRTVKEVGLGHDTPSGGEASPQVRDLVASFQFAVVRALVNRTVSACRREQVKTVIVAGGVACNTRLRQEFARVAEREKLRVYFPSPQYTTDNAAMIGAAAFLHFERGAWASVELDADASLRL